MCHGTWERGRGHDRLVALSSFCCALTAPLLPNFIPSISNDLPTNSYSQVWLYNTNSECISARKLIQDLSCNACTYVHMCWSHLRKCELVMLRNVLIWLPPYLRMHVSWPAWGKIHVHACTHLVYLCLSLYYTDTCSRPHLSSGGVCTDLGGWPSSTRFPSTCSLTFTKSVGLAKNCPPAPAIIPVGIAFLHVGTQTCNGGLYYLEVIYCL